MSDINKRKNKFITNQPQREYLDRNEIERECFPDFTISCKTPETAILLLGSPQTEVILNAIQHLDKFSVKQIQNTEILYNFGIVKTILLYKLYEHEELFIRRFALKLLASIFELKNSKFDEEIKYEIFEITKNYYKNIEDNFIIEYSSIILLSILDEPRLCVLLENDTEFIINGIYKQLSHTKDPDILYNSYRLLLKIIKYAVFVLKICDIQKIPFERILSNINNEFKEIRSISLDIFGELIECQYKESLELRFICETFFNETFKVLENENFSDNHEKIFEIFRNLMKKQNIAKLFIRQGYLYKYVKNLKNRNVSQRLIASGVINELANYSIFLEIVYDFGFVDMCLEFLKNQDLINLDVIVGIKRMLAYPDAFLRIVQENITLNLISFIDDRTKLFKISEIAANTLQILCEKNKKVSEDALKNKINLVIAKYLNEEFGEIPTDFLLQLTNILNALAKHEEIRSTVMDSSMAKSFYYALKNSSRSSLLRTNLFKSATIYAFEQSLQDEFLNSEDFGKIILGGLKSLAITLKTAAADFLIVTGKIKQFSDRYVEDEILEYLIDDQKSLSICPSWSQAIEAILSTNPSLKFSIRGKLDINDLIGDDFLISKHHWKNLSLLKKLKKQQICPLYPTIIVNFNHPICSPDSIVHIKNDYADWVMCFRPCDEYLPSYLEKLREILKIKELVQSTKNPKLLNVSNFDHIIKTLAEFVCRSMSGVNQGEQTSFYNESAVKNHLNTLKYQLHSNVIPLGYILYGGYFERAILFKALADQIGLPCTLVRGVDGRILYNGVPISTQENEEKCSFTKIPKKLLTASHVVDLMKYPGEMYPLESRQAYYYLKLL